MLDERDFLAGEPSQDDGRAPQGRFGHRAAAEGGGCARRCARLACNAHAQRATCARPPRTGSRVRAHARAAPAARAPRLQTTRVRWSSSCASWSRTCAASRSHPSRPPSSRTRACPSASRSSSSTGTSPRLRAPRAARAPPRDARQRQLCPRWARTASRALCAAVGHRTRAACAGSRPCAGAHGSRKAPSRRLVPSPPAPAARRAARGRARAGAARWTRRRWTR